MAGSIRKRTWTTRKGEEKTAWLVDYSDQSGKRHRPSFATRREAKAWLTETQHELSRGIHVAPNNSPTIAKAGRVWLAQGEADGLEYSTLEQYRQHLELHIIPFIGAVTLVQLTPAQLAEFRHELHKAGRSPAMTKRAIGSLGAILASAMAQGQVGRNIVRDSAARQRRLARLDRRHKRQLVVGEDIPAKDEIRLLIDQARGFWRVLLITAIFTGLRASELRGLTWKDVGFGAVVLSVRQRADRRNVMGSPKSPAARREIPLAPIVSNTLREWRLACPKGDLGLVFPTDKGAVQGLPNLHRGLGALQVRVGLAESRFHPKYGLHSLRHAAASLFIEQGRSAKWVQVVMGHSSIQVTFDTYGHLFPAPESDQEAMQQIQARLLGGL